MTIISMALMMLLTATAAAGPGEGQDHAGCPLAAPPTHRADVDRRHDEVSGTAHDSVVHHFVLARDGGSIQLEMADASDPEGRDRIRQHLRMVARAFALGDFTMPMLVHDQTPPGVDIMKARKDRIRYRFSATDQGAAVRISTRDAEALAAVHAFLRFQIQDHATGDPTD
jgi:hypothetical protein